MGNNALLVQIVLGLLVIFFFVTVFFSARSWRWPHMVFISFTFLAAIFFVMLAAIELKVQKAWRTEVNKMSKDLEAQLKIKDAVQFGDVTKVEQEPNLRSVRAEIGRMLLDRGRVWRECQPGAFDGMTVTVQTVPAVLPEGQAAKANNIEVGAILYLFKEVLTAENFKLPGDFLGEFKATAVTESSVTLAPNIPLDPQQIAGLRAADAPSWVLYEVLPLDGHEFFAGLSEEQLRALFPNNAKVPEAKFNAIIQSYLRTGTAAQDSDAPETKWVKVKFTKKVAVDVDTPDANPTEIMFFDREGRAVAHRLRRGEPVEFELGDVALVDPETAKKWIDAGEAEKIEEVYQRPLNDYAQAFASHFTRMNDLKEKIARMKRDTASIEASTMKSEAQLVKLLAEKTKLEEDKANFVIEQEVVTGFTDRLNAQSDVLRQQLREAFGATQALRDELVKLQQQLTDEINRRQVAKTASLR